MALAGRRAAARSCSRTPHLLFLKGIPVKNKPLKIDAQTRGQASDAKHSVCVCLGVTDLTRVLVVPVQNIRCHKSLKGTLQCFHTLHLHPLLWSTHVEWMRPTSKSNTHVGASWTPNSTTLRAPEGQAQESRSLQSFGPTRRCTDGTSSRSCSFHSTAAIERLEPA